MDETYCAFRIITIMMMMMMVMIMIMMTAMTMTTVLFEMHNGKLNTEHYSHNRTVKYAFIRYKRFYPMNI